MKIEPEEDYEIGKEEKEKAAKNSKILAILIVVIILAVIGIIVLIISLQEPGLSVVVDGVSVNAPSDTFIITEER